MSLVRSQQCTVWSSDRSRRMRNLMRLQLSQNFLTCWILKGKIITTDAMGLPERYCREDTKTGGDYLFAVKGNRGG